MALSLTRLWYLFKLQWAENRKLYLYSLLALVGAMAVVLFSVTERETAQGGIFIGGLFLSDFIFTSSLLNRFSDKPRSICALMLPVSALEKTVVATVYSMVVFPVLYVALIYPVVLLVYYYHWVINGDLCLLYRAQQDIGILVLLFFISQAFTLFCSVMFNRFSLVKTVALACLVVLGTIFINAETRALLFNGVDPAVLPAGYEPNPPNKETINNLKRIDGGKSGSLPAHDSLLNTHKTTGFSRQLNRNTEDPYSSIHFFSSNVGQNSTYWTVEQPAAIQYCFFGLHIMVIPILWWLTFLRLKEKFLA